MHHSINLADYALEQKRKFESLANKLEAGLHERDLIIRVCLLACLTGHNTFLYGPPGTAKSLISRRLSCAFADAKYFDILMQKFTTPEEVFGPVSIKELKADNYMRRIDNYLPGANFAFLDEIWKSSSAVLNSLLTIINEGIYRNGAQLIHTQLRSLMAASNEIPSADSGLSAMYDRFSVRLLVDTIKSEENFRSFLTGGGVSDRVTLDPNDTYTQDQLMFFRGQVKKVSLSAETMNVIWDVKEGLAKHDIYVSDRRWRKIVDLIRACALVNGRDETNTEDCVVMMHTLWEEPDEIKKVAEVIANAQTTHASAADTQAKAQAEQKRKASLGNFTAGIASAQQLWSKIDKSAEMILSIRMSQYGLNPSTDYEQMAQLYNTERQYAAQLQESMEEQAEQIGKLANLLVGNRNNLQGRNKFIELLTAELDTLNGKTPAKTNNDLKGKLQRLCDLPDDFEQLIDSDFFNFDSEDLQNNRSCKETVLYDLIQEIKELRDLSSEL